MKKSTLMPLKKDLTLNVLDHEIAIREKGESIGEEYYNMKRNKRICHYNAIVTSDKAKLIFIKFSKFKNTIYPYKDSKIEFKKLCNNRLKILQKKLKRKKIEPFILNYDPGKEYFIKHSNHKKGAKSTKKRERRISAGDFGIKKILLKGKGVRVRSLVKPRKKKGKGGKEEIVRPNIEDGMKQLIIDRLKKDDVYRSFNCLKPGKAIERIQSIRIDPVTTPKTYLFNVVTPNHKLPLKNKLEMISRSKRSLDKKKVIHKKKIDFLSMARSCREKKHKEFSSSIHGGFFSCKERHARSLGNFKLGHKRKNFTSFKEKSVLIGSEFASFHGGALHSKVNLAEIGEGEMAENGYVLHKTARLHSKLSLFNGRDLEYEIASQDLDDTKTLSIILNNKSIEVKMPKKHLKLNPISKRLMYFKKNKLRKKDRLHKLMRKIRGHKTDYSVT